MNYIFLVFSLFNVSTAIFRDVIIKNIIVKRKFLNGQVVVQNYTQFVPIKDGTVNLTVKELRKIHSEMYNFTAESFDGNRSTDEPVKKIDKVYSQRRSSKLIKAKQIIRKFKNEIDKNNYYGVNETNNKSINRLNTRYISINETTVNLISNELTAKHNDLSNVSTIAFGNNKTDKLGDKIDEDYIQRKSYKLKQNEQIIQKFKNTNNGIDDHEVNNTFYKSTDRFIEAAPKNLTFRLEKVTNSMKIKVLNPVSKQINNVNALKDIKRVFNIVFVDKRLSFDDADQHCRDRSVDGRSELISIRDKHEGQGLIRWVKPSVNQYYWIGGKMILSRLRYKNGVQLIKWSDGSTTNLRLSFKYNRINQGVRNMKDLCISINFNLGLLKIFDCSKMLGYVCLMKP